MYNRILNRPMFKLGGDTVDAQGTGITSGLDTPRQGYNSGTSLEDIDIRTNIEESKLKVTPEQYRSNAMDAIASGFLNPDARTMGEALYFTNQARKSGIEPLESSVAEKKFELSKIPLETRGAILATPESATKTRAKILSAAMRRRNKWEAENPGEDFRQSPLYTEWELDVIQATQGKIKTRAEARESAIEILMLDETFAKMFTMLPMMPEGPDKVKYQAQIDAQLRKLVDYFMGVEAKAHGGRIGYQLGVGPNVMEEKVTDTFQMPGETIQASEQVEEVLPKNGSTGQLPMPGQDPYMLLRARLPQEITDDVVRLIAYNAEAFADFAAIESQEDVMLFNQKYQVELVLPTEQA